MANPFSAWIFLGSRFKTLWNSNSARSGFFSCAYKFARSLRTSRSPGSIARACLRFCAASPVRPSFKFARASKVNASALCVSILRKVSAYSFASSGRSARMESTERRYKARVFFGSRFRIDCRIPVASGVRPASPYFCARKPSTIGLSGSALRASCKILIASVGSALSRSTAFSIWFQTAMRSFGSMWLTFAPPLPLT